MNAIVDDGPHAVMGIFGNEAFLGSDASVDSLGFSTVAHHASAEAYITRDFNHPDFRNHTVYAAFVENCGLNESAGMRIAPADYIGAHSAMNNRIETSEQLVVGKHRLSESASVDNTVDNSLAANIVGYPCDDFGVALHYGASAEIAVVDVATHHAENPADNRFAATQSAGNSSKLKISGHEGVR